MTAWLFSCVERSGRLGLDGRARRPLLALCRCSPTASSSSAWRLVVAPVADCLAARGPCRTCASVGAAARAAFHLLWWAAAAVAAARATPARRRRPPARRQARAPRTGARSAAPRPPAAKRRHGAARASFRETVPTSDNSRKDEQRAKKCGRGRGTEQRRNPSSLSPPAASASSSAVDLRSRRSPS